MYTNLANSFADMFCEGAVEHSIDMMSECPEEYKTFQDAASCIEYSVKSFSDAALDDYLNDFVSMVKACVAKRRVKVHHVVVTEEGFKDVDYSIVKE